LFTSLSHSLSVRARQISSAATTRFIEPFAAVKDPKVVSLPSLSSFRHALHFGAANTQNRAPQLSSAFAGGSAVLRRHLPPLAALPLAASRSIQRLWLRSLWTEVNWSSIPVNSAN
jgi:hypothetical protein